MDHVSELHYLVQSDENLGNVRKRLYEVHDLNFRITLATTLLREAVGSKLDNLRVVKELINAGADVNLSNRCGLTPLHYAVLERKHGVVDALIKSGANINAKSNLKRTALHFAISNYQYDQRKRTLLSQSSGPDRRIIIKLLEEENLRINKGDIRGDTPLMWAVMHKQLDIVPMLLKKGANPSIQNKDFSTPLHIALSDQDPSIAILIQLLTNRASIKCADREGITAIDILINNIRNTQSYNVTYICVKFIALLYKIKKPLKRKIESNYHLWYHLKNCCEELERMSSDIIATRVTVFDFIIKRVTESDIYKPEFQVHKTIVERLLAGHYPRYSILLIPLVSKSNLLTILEKTVLDSKNSKEMLDAKNYKEVSDAKDSQEMPGAKDCKEMPDGKDYKEMPDGKDYKEMPDGKDYKEMPDGKDYKEMPDGKDYKEMPDGKDYKEMPDGKDYKEMPGAKDCKEMPGANDCAKINLTELLLQIDMECLTKFLSSLDIYSLISAFS